MTDLTKKHGRLLGLIGTAMTESRLPRFSMEVATDVRDEIEGIMRSCNYLEGAPFDWVTISLRYGIVNEDEPHFESISEKYGDLPLSIELDTRELAAASREQLSRSFRTAVLKALVSAGDRYDLNCRALETELDGLLGPRHFGPVD